MANDHPGGKLRILFAMLAEIPVRDDENHAVFEHSQLPNGMPVLLINPENLPLLIAAARHRSNQDKQVVELVAVDLEEIYDEEFVSPSQVEGMPEWYSIN